MPDLSAYLDFSVELDYVSGELKLTDTSAYPGGVANGITGIIKTIQPDTIIREGDWNSPDVEYSGSALTVGAVELRTKTDNTPQPGIYTVTYIVDHASYSPTTKTKQFVLSFTPPSHSITENLDVFTPDASLDDSTNHAVNSWTTTTLTRAWSIDIGSVTTITGSGSSIDLEDAGSVYDALHEGTLTTTGLYTHQTYSYLTLRWRTISEIEIAVKTPPDWDTLLTYWKAIKTRFNALASCARTTSARQDYDYASSLIGHIKQRICDSDFDGLYDEIQDFLNVYFQRVSQSHTHTELAIQAYDTTGVDCGSGGGGGGVTLPDDLTYIIGVTSGAPTAGASTFTLAQMDNKRIRLHINRIKQSTVAYNSDPYYAKPEASDTITLYNMTWQSGDLIQIEYY